jgi:hypothetical protein
MAIFNSYVSLPEGSKDWRASNVKKTMKHDEPIWTMFAEAFVDLVARPLVAALKTPICETS